MVNTKAPSRLALTATLRFSMPSFLRASHANVKVARIAVIAKNNSKKLIDLFRLLPYSFPVNNTTTATMTKKEIVLETIEFYSNNPRSKSSESKMCCYQDPMGNRCAVGRCIDEDCMAVVADAEQKRGGFEILHFERRVGVELEECLQEKYRGHPIHFWKSLQILHDGDHFWKDGKLHEEAKKFIYDELDVYLK